MTGDLIRRREDTDKEKGQAKTEAEPGVMWLQSEECRGPQTLEEAWKGPFLGPLETAGPCRHLHA